MNTSLRAITTALLCSGFALAPITYGETPATTPAAAAKPAPMPAGGTGNGMMKCAQENMKDGKCPHSGMDNDHMKQMHEHMQQMHPQTSAPAGGAVTAPKKTEPTKPTSAEDHSAHHPAQ
jgi:hypothetical protein